MQNSEIQNQFDEKRNSFKPYGFTCEVWTPGIMSRADQHNEIEINYFPSGSITYLIRGEKKPSHPIDLRYSGD